MKNKRVYKKKIEHADDITYENELENFFKNLANNTPNAEQFEEEDLDKKS
tara:strand:+ start:564 stop:713 length:150 start_codon:yes stop_codon:yes gene_type:complete